MTAKRGPLPPYRILTSSWKPGWLDGGPVPMEGLIDAAAGPVVERLPEPQPVNGPACHLPFKGLLFPHPTIRHVTLPVRTYDQLDYVQGDTLSSKKKLTLSVDQHVIERARRYSIRHKTSVSQLVSTYLSQLDSPSDQRLSPLVRRLLGILPQDVEMEDYHRHLGEKDS